MTLTPDATPVDELAQAMVRWAGRQVELNEGQRALVAAKPATRRREHSLIQNIRPDDDIQPSGKTTQQAAELLNVGKDTVSCAKTVLAEGTPEEIAPVEDGKTAKVVGVSPRSQRRHRP